MTPNNDLRTIKEIRIFLASPSDVGTERDIVQDNLNKIEDTITRRRDTSLRLFRWEDDTYPKFHQDGPQGAIYDQLSIEDCDVFVCIFWNRFGSPTKNAKSGTEDEFWKAFESWKKTNKPMIMLYRSFAPPADLRSIDPIQMLRVRKFFDDRRFKNEKWVCEYKSLDEFRELNYRHLADAIQDIMDGKISKTIDNDAAEAESELLPDLDIPKDWKVVTYSSLKKFYVDLPEANAIAFFDGLEPTWKEAVSTSIGRREKVEAVKNELLRTDVATPHIVLLRGFGGEGKSTVIRQALYETMASNPSIHVLWHENTNSALDMEIIEELSDTDYEWIIASDDAHNLVKDLKTVVRQMREEDIRNISLLLTSRDLDWKAVGGDDFGLGRLASFTTIFVEDLTETDARLIVEKWGAYGSKGLGLLEGKDLDSAAADLLKKARTERKTHDYSLLGAMLQVRTGKTMQEHYKPILERLDGTRALDNISLRKAIAFIAALHAYNLKLVTPEILAHALGCSEDELQEKVINPLKGEVVVGKYVLIRHVSIAEAIKDILSAHYDFTWITCKLFNSAQTLSRTRKVGFVEDLNDWNRLPKTMFFEKNDHALGIELAEEAVVSERINDTQYDPVAVTDLAYLLERDGQINRGVRTLREKYPLTKVDRAYYYKWGVVEGKSGHNLLNIWLTGISIADGIFEQRRDPSRIYVSMSGLTYACHLIYLVNKDRRFLEASYAAAALGLEHHPDERAQKHLRQNLHLALNEGIKDDEVDQLGTIKNIIFLAWSKREEDLRDNEFGSFPEGVPPANKLKFTWLEKTSTKPKS